MPLKDKDTYLVYLANTLAQNSIMIFTRTVHDTARYACILFAQNLSSHNI